MDLYRVVNWDNTFENNRTRVLENMRWVPVPNKHDGDGFTTMLAQENGTALYGAWQLILQVASKCLPRGTLLRDGAGPHTAASLSRVTRGDEQVFTVTLRVACEIGWLEAIPFDINDLQNPALACVHPALACVRMTMEGKGREGKRIEGNGIPKTPKAESLGAVSKSERPRTANQQNTVADIWFKVYRSQNHADPVLTGRDKSALKQLGELFPDRDVLRKILKAYTSDGDSWLAQKGWPLHEVLARVNRYTKQIAYQEAPNDPAADPIEGIGEENDGKCASA